MPAKWRVVPATANQWRWTLIHVTLAMQVPMTEECLQPIVNIVSLQLLSYHLTALWGHNVDQPRNLAKSVTVSAEHEFSAYHNLRRRLSFSILPA